MYTSALWGTKGNELHCTIITVYSTITMIINYEELFLLWRCSGHTKFSGKCFNILF